MPGFKLGCSLVVKHLTSTQKGQSYSFSATNNLANNRRPNSIYFLLWVINRTACIKVLCWVPGSCQPTNPTGLVSPFKELLRSSGELWLYLGVESIQGNLPLLPALSLWLTAQLHTNLPSLQQPSTLSRTLPKRWIISLRSSGPGQLPPCSMSTSLLSYWLAGQGCICSKHTHC